jgi:hypothetical protein
VELFENYVVGEIPAGTLLTLEGDKVRIAMDGDIIDGVVSFTGGIVMGDSSFCWQGRYLHDVWGKPVYHDTLNVLWESTIPDPDWPKEIPDPKDPDRMILNPEQQPRIPNPEPQGYVSTHKENPDWDPDLPQVPRSERPAEWTRVGLLGKVRVRVDDTVVPNSRVAASDNGIGTFSTEHTGLRCMKILQPFDVDTGYAVAFCYINVAA